MNILKEIDNLAHLKLIAYFDEFSQNELSQLKDYRNKINILSLNELSVSYILS